MIDIDSILNWNQRENIPIYMQHHGISQRANLILSVRNQTSFFRKKKDLFVKPCNPEKRSWIYSQVCALKNCTFILALF